MSTSANPLSHKAAIERAVRRAFAAHDEADRKTNIAMNGYHLWALGLQPIDKLDAAVLDAMLILPELAAYAAAARSASSTGAGKKRARVADPERSDKKPRPAVRTPRSLRRRDRTPSYDEGTRKRARDDSDDELGSDFEQSEGDDEWRPSESSSDEEEEEHGPNSGLRAAIDSGAFDDALFAIAPSQPRPKRARTKGRARRLSKIAFVGLICLGDEEHEEASLVVDKHGVGEFVADVGDASAATIVWMEDGSSMRLCANPPPPYSASSWPSSSSVDTERGTALLPLPSGLDEESLLADLSAFGSEADIQDGVEALCSEGPVPLSLLPGLLLGRDNVEDVAEAMETVEPSKGKGGLLSVVLSDAEGGSEPTDVVLFAGGYFRVATEEDRRIHPRIVSAHARESGAPALHFASRPAATGAARVPVKDFDPDKGKNRDLTPRFSALNQAIREPSASRQACFVSFAQLSLLAPGFVRTFKDLKPTKKEVGVFQDVARSRWRLKFTKSFEGKQRSFALGQYVDEQVVKTLANWLHTQPVEMKVSKGAPRRFLDLLFPAAIRPSDVGKEMRIAEGEDGELRLHVGDELRPVRWDAAFAPPKPIEAKIVGLVDDSVGPNTVLVHVRGAEFQHQNPFSVSAHDWEEAERRVFVELGSSPPSEARAASSSSSNEPSEGLKELCAILDLE